jgi:hypothetical protein
VLQVARNKCQTDEYDSGKVSELAEWPGFKGKLIKWVCLCECFPYRMSLLVLVILDFEQRALSNNVILEKEHPYKEQMFTFDLGKHHNTSAAVAGSAAEGGSEDTQQSHSRSFFSASAERAAAEKKAAVNAAVGLVAATEASGDVDGLAAAQKALADAKAEQQSQTFFQRSLETTQEARLNWDDKVNLQSSTMRVALIHKVVQVISSIFFEDAVQLMCIHDSRDGMQRLDGDPEIFALLLSQPIPPDPSIKESSWDDLRVRDVLGPVDHKELHSNRDQNLALMSYSFNLNPALRAQLSGELALLTQYEMARCDGTQINYRHLSQDQHENESRLDRGQRQTRGNHLDLLIQEEMRPHSRISAPRTIS